MDISAFYGAIGENYEAVYRRLLSSERIEKYLSRFFQQNQIEDLQQQMKAQDFAAAMNSAHILKGVASTLGLDGVTGTVCELHTALKENRADEATALLCELLTGYETVVSEWNRFTVQDE